MNEPEVIAQRGASVLIRVDETRGRILDRRHGRLFPQQSIESALARGYWETFTGDPAEIADALTVAREITSTAETPGLLAVSVESHTYHLSA